MTLENNYNTLKITSKARYIGFPKTIADRKIMSFLR